MDYEGGLHSLSKIEDDDFENPIYDSKEDPIPKAKKMGGNGNRANVMMSGDSFGKNPLNRSSYGKEMANNGKNRGPHRNQIAENLLEDLEDPNESGEINPSMFR
jgi:hypothetical protein